MPITLADGVRGQEPPGKLGFTFRLAGGAGKLTLGRRTFFGWLHLDRLELEVPNLRLPVDLATGAEAFQRHRTLARVASLRMEQADLDRFLALRVPALEDLGVEELRVTCGDGYLGLNGRVRESGQVGELTARVYLDAEGERIRFACGRALVYGYLPTPAPLIAHRVIAAVLGGSPGEVRFDAQSTGIQGTGVHGPTGTGVHAAQAPHASKSEVERDGTFGPWSSQVRGLGEVELEPLALTLWHILPSSGWRLPDTSGLQVSDVRVGPGGLVVSYRAVADPATDPTGPSIRGPELMHLFDSLERLRDGDERLVYGDLDGAMRLYRSRLASSADEEPLLLERMLAVGSAQRELFDECAELAARALVRWPDFAAAQAALASIAVARGDVLGAGSRYRALTQIAGAAGDRDAAIRAALAGARLLRRVAPPESTPLYERVLELAPGHGETVDALSERYADERRWSDLVRLLRARAARSEDADRVGGEPHGVIPRDPVSRLGGDRPGGTVRRARDHIRVAQILVAELGDPVAARQELEPATRLDPHSPAAHEVLADIEIALGNPTAGADALERAAILYGERRDRRSQSRARLRAAGLRDQAGDRERAEVGYRAVLELSPGEPAALRGAARAAMRRGEHDAAAQMWRSLVALSAGSPHDAARDSLELARALLSSERVAPGDREAAMEALRRAAASGSPAVAADGHELLAELARIDRRRADAAQHLSQAIDALAAAAQSEPTTGELRARASALALARADLLAQLEEQSAAVAEYERAFALSAEGSPVRLTAARTLAKAAYDQGDLGAERHWIAAQLGHQQGDQDRAHLLVRRAELALEAGEDLVVALADLDRALELDLPPDGQSRGLALRANVLGALGDHAGRARALDRALEAAIDPVARIELSIAASRARLHTGDFGTALVRARGATGAVERGEHMHGSPPLVDAAVRDLAREALITLGEGGWRAREFADVERAYGELMNDPTEAAAGPNDDDDDDGPARTRHEWAYRLGFACEALGKLDAAAAAYEVCIAEAATPPDTRVTAWRSLATIFEHTADLARAALAYESFAGDKRADLGDAARAEAWYRAGDLYRKAGGREADAERCLEAALQMVSDHMPALDVLERLKRDGADWERVAVILGRKIAATTRQPGSQKSLLCRLAALQEERLGRPDVAREGYTRALVIDPDYRPALRFAARNAASRGDTDRAIESYAKLASVLPGDDELKSGDELADERADAAIELAALVSAAPSQERTETATRALRANLEAMPQHPRMSQSLAALERASRLPPAPPVEDMLTNPRALDSFSDLVGEARAAVHAEQPERAHSMLDGIDRERASDEVLELRAQVGDHLGDRVGAAGDLETLRARAVQRLDPVLELRATRRLAALVARQKDDDRRAVELYQRVLALDPDDLAAAEACAEIFSHRREMDLYRSALARVLEVTRRTGAGRQREVRVLREMAWSARSHGDLAAAANLLDEACAIDPSATDALRERADLATAQGDAEDAAHWLETLVARLEEIERSGARPPGPTLAGEIHLELADLYYDQLGDVPRARAAMRRAADAFGRGARRDATLRLLASEAAAAGAAAEAAAALEEIAAERLSPGDRLMLAKCYQRTGRDHKAIELLEAARQAQVLSDEGALLLFAMGRHRKQKEDLAVQLERGARGAPYAIATTRLREALELYRSSLGDEVAAAQVESDLERLERGEELAPLEIIREPDQDRAGTLVVQQGSALDDGLAAAAELEKNGALDAAAARYEELWAQAPADLRALEALERLYLDRGDAEAVSEVLGRMIVAAEDRQFRAGLWFRRARLYRDLLHREAEAYRCLKEAFANHPESPDVANALRTIAMTRGEWGLAAELIYREIAAAPDVPERAALFLELGLIYDEKLLDGPQAIRCYEQALALDPQIPAAPRPLARLYEMAARHLDAAATFERAVPSARDARDRAGLYRLAAAAAERGGDANGARRLRLAADGAAEDGDLDDLPAPPSASEPSSRIRLLEDRLRRTRDPEAIGDLHRQIIELAGATGDTATLEHHASALLEFDRADLSAFLVLRNHATQNGNWRTLADLLQVRAGAVADPVERATLLVDLGRLYDRQVGDQVAAANAYEQALAAAPAHPGALEALADIAYGNGDWARASELYALLDPHTASLAPDILHSRRGEIAEVLGSDHEACAFFAEAVRLHPGNRQALTALSRTALRIGDLPRAIAASRALLDLIPVDDVRAVRAARLQLAELCQRSGDSPTAIAFYEQVLADEPRSITALSSLLGLYSETGDHPSGARVLRQLIAITPAPQQRAELLYRLGELCRRGLGDSDLAADSYLKAIDLDPDHLPTLRRLLEFYWHTGDQKNLLDVARDLDRRGALCDPSVAMDTLGGVMLIASLRGSEPMAIAAAHFLQAAAAPALAEALIEEIRREGAPLARNLVSTALGLAMTAGFDPAVVRSELERRGGRDEAARVLAAAWPAPRH
ncbi:MAG TPA: tetratricopeptide repeat protein [Kofleriaceae bacterium]